MKTVFRISVLVFGAAIISAGIYFLKGREKETSNPFKYRVDKYSHVDPALIKFKEHASLKIDVPSIHAIAIDRQDRVYISTPKIILIFDKGLRKTGQIATQEPAYCLEVANDDHIYAGFKTDLAIFNQKGKQLNRIAFNPEKSILTAICSTSKYLFIADAGEKQIKRLLKGKNAGELIPEDISYRFNPFVLPSAFFDIKKDGVKGVWVTNPGKHTLENYSIHGQFIKSWTRASLKIEGFAGCCNPVHIAIRSNGNIITSEKGLNRIKEYSSSGELISVVASPRMIGHQIENPDIAVNSQDDVILLDNTVKKIRIFKRK